MLLVSALILVHVACNGFRGCSDSGGPFIGECEAEKLPFPRSVNRAFVLVDFQPELLLQKSCNALHQSFPSPLALNIDVAIVSIPDKLVSTSDSTSRWTPLPQATANHLYCSGLSPYRKHPCQAHYTNAVAPCHGINFLIIKLKLITDKYTQKQLLVCAYCAILNIELQ